MGDTQLLAEGTLDIVEDLYLSDVEELLDECDFSSPMPERLRAEDLPSLRCARSPPEGEAAALLAQLAANCPRFDPGDYWVNDSWDLQALREDVELEWQERCAQRRYAG